MKKLFKTLVVSLLTLLCLPTLAAATQPKSTITISPFLREVRFSADEATKDFSIEITNNTGQAQSFNLSVLDFGSLDDSGGVVFAGSDASTLVKKYGLSGWLQLDQKSLSIEPNKTAEIKATIVNDKFMAPGGHYAAVVASINSPGAEASNEININQQLSSLILATKVGGERYDLKLNKISTEGSWVRLPKSVTLKFNNPGNVHVVPRGTVKILSVGGEVVAQGVINEESGFVLPETSRAIAVEMYSVGSVGLWPAMYHLQVDYRYDGISKFVRKDQSLYFINTTGLAKILILLSAAYWIYRKARKPKK